MLSTLIGLLGFIAGHKVLGIKFFCCLVEYLNKNFV